MATIIDALLVTLGLDTSGFKKGAEESNAELGKLKANAHDTAEAVSADGAKAGEFFLKFAERAAVLVGVTFSIRGVLNAIQDTAKEYDTLAKLAAQFHTTAEAVDDFADAGQLLGLSKEQTIGGLKQLDKAVQDTALGLGRAKVIFKDLGIEVKDAAGNVKPTTEVLGELQSKLAGMERGKQIRIMERLGLDPALLKLFTADMADIQRRTEAIDKSTGFNLDTAVKNSQAFTKALKGVQLEVNTLKMFFEKLFETAYIEAMPALTEVLLTVKKYAAELFDFFTEHKDFVVGVIIAIAAGVTYFLLPALIEAGIAAVAALAPFLLIALAIAAIVGVFALLYDDWKVWSEGGTSAFGAFWQFFADVWKQIGGLVTTVVGDIVSVFSTGFGVLMDVLRLFKALFTGDSADISAAWDALCGAIGDAWAAEWKLVVDVLHATVAAILAVWPTLWANIKAGASAFGEWMLGRFAALGGAIAGVVGRMVAPWVAAWGIMRNAAGAAIDWVMGKIAALVGAASKVASLFGIGGGGAAPAGTQAGAGGTVAGAPAAPNAAPAAGSAPQQAAAVPPILPPPPSAQQASRALAAAAPARAASAVPPSVTNRGGNTSTVTKTTHIDAINVHTAATDAPGIAGSIGGAVKSNAMADQADAGM